MTLRDVTAQVSATAPARPGRNRIAVVGIDRYRGGWPRLDNAVSDARGALRAFQRLGFEPVGEALYDDAATAGAIRSLVADDLAQLTEDDNLVVFFAGHGHTVTRRYADGHAVKIGYLIPVDAEHPTDTSARWLPVDNWLRDLARIPVRHILVFLDACHSGIALGPLIKWRSAADASALARPGQRRAETTESREVLRRRRSRKVITSALDDQRALDSGPMAGHSLFTGCLIEGLDGGIAPHGELVTGSELGHYIQRRVTSYPDSQQTPDVGPFDEDGRGEILLRISTDPIARTEASPLREADQPYPDLRGLGDPDRARLLGRDAVVGQLVEAIVARPLTIVVGPPGTGRSSLVHAGAVPALRDRGWTVLTAPRPGDAPLAVLRVWTEQLGGVASDREPAAWLAAVAARAGQTSWLVVIDRLEDTVGHRDGAAVLDALAVALRRCPALRIAATVRADAEPRLAEGALGPWWAAGRFVAPPPGRDELRQIIEQPAGVAAVHFEPARLVDELIDDTAQAAAPLAMLSFALAELYRAGCARWQSGLRDRALHEADYRAIGGVTGAVDRRATALHDALVAAQPALAATIRTVMLRMVAFHNGELVGRRVMCDELRPPDPEERGRIDHVVARFAAAGLLALGAEPTGTGEARGYVEPAHDAVIRGWTCVRRWLDTAPPVPRGWSGTASHRDRRVRAVRSVLAGRRRLAGTYLEIGRQLVLDGHPREALPYLVEARIAGGPTTPLRMLFATASRHLTALPLEPRGPVVSASPATASDDPTAQVWSAVTDAMRYPALEHDGVVVSAKFSADGTRVVTASDDHTARVWDAATGKLAAPPLTHGDTVSSAEFSPDGMRVVTASSDGTVRVWDAATGKPVTPALEHRAAVASVAFSCDGARIVAASEDGTALVWDLVAGAPASPLLEHGGVVWSAAFSPDGARILTASADGTAQIWDAATGKPVVAALEHRGSLRGAAFSSDGARVVTVSWDNTARVWDAATGEPVSPPLVHRSIVWRAAFSGDGRRVVTASHDKTARLWDAATGELLARPLEHRDKVWAAAFSRDGSRVVTASSDRTARVWDAASGQPVTPPLDHGGEVWSAAFSPDGTRVVTACDDRLARIWDMPVDARSLADWLAVAERSPYVLVDGVLSLRRGAG